MAEATPKTKLPSRRAKYDVRLSFLDKKNPDTKPSISDEKARQLLDAIEALDGDEVVASQACTNESCGQVVKGVKRLAAEFDVTLSCRYTCIWTYSKLGGWQRECYFRCSGKGITLEGTGAL
jgi:hypothetical protein